MAMSSSSSVYWEWRNGSNWSRFDQQASDDVEEGYQAWQDTSYVSDEEGDDESSCCTMDIDISGTGRTYTVDFINMEQTNTITGFSRAIRRIDSASATGGAFLSSFSSSTIATTQSSTSATTQNRSQSTATSKSAYVQKSSESYKSVPIPKNNVDFPRAQEKDWKGKECPICMEDFTSEDDKAGTITKLRECVGHSFHLSCVKDYIIEHSKCPQCGYFYGDKYGPQPDGEMQVSYSRGSLPGNPHCGTITISFNFPSQKATDKHPNPGQQFCGESRVHYMPDDAEGQKVLKLFVKAWNQRLLFNVGYSLTRQQDNCLIYNGVHMKTSQSGGPSGHGWPDPTYFVRVQTELSEKGIHTLTDLTAEEIAALKAQNEASKGKGGMAGEETKEPEK